MVVGTGIDIIEINRFSDSREKWGGDFLRKIFTEKEISYSSNRRFSDQHLAARFAAKEAVFKAFGTDKGSIRRWSDIEVLNDDSGRPSIVLHGSALNLYKEKKISGIMVSISHSKNSAVASAILTA